MLLRQAARHGQRRLVSIGGQTLTYAEASEAAAEYAAALTAAGIKPGDRVAIMCGNRAELLLIILGCGWLVAIAVPINVALCGAQLGTHPEQLRCTTDGDRARTRASRFPRLRPRPLSARNPVAGRRKEVEELSTASAAHLSRHRKKACRRTRLSRYTFAILYTSRHDRPVQRRARPARAIFPGGRSIWATSSVCAKATC